MQIISKKEALRRGLKQYFTGLRCRNGHVAPQMMYRDTCVICNSIRCANYRKNNPEKQKARALKAKIEARANAQERKAQKEAYYLEHKDTLDAIALEKSLEREQNLKLKQKKYYSENKTKILAYRKKYRQKNAQKVKKYLQEYQESKRDPFKIEANRKKAHDSFINATFETKYQAVKNSIKLLLKAIKTDSLYIPDDSPYNSIKFKAHIESKFSNSMSWDNHYTFWELHHIIPISKILKDNPQGSKNDIFSRCNALSNIVPLEKSLHSLLHVTMNKDTSSLTIDKYKTLTRYIQNTITLKKFDEDEALYIQELHVKTLLNSKRTTNIYHLSFENEDIYKPLHVKSYQYFLAYSKENNLFSFLIIADDAPHLIAIMKQSDLYPIENHNIQIELTAPSYQAEALFFLFKTSFKKIKVS